MGEKIAMGFHTCVDYELVWDTAIVEEQIRAFDIHAEELKPEMEVDSERALWIGCLAHLRAGIGGEIVPAQPHICVDFANHFRYEITLGGTATRAAIVLSRMGYPSVLQTSCYNEHVKRLMPARIHVLPGVAPDHNEIYPHVILQCFGGIRIHANDIDFVTPRENRILISRDVDSLNIPVLDKEFGALITDAEVFLLGCFSEILDREILENRVEKTKSLLSHLPEDALVVMEDGCYVKKDFRYYVHEQLAPVTDILSMNEDEMQDYIGKRIDLLDPEAVRSALETVRLQSGMKILLVHSAAWALAYGEHAAMLETSLEGGVTMAATRFRVGDHLTPEAYEATGKLAAKADSVVFCAQMKQMLGDQICCIPCKDLRRVEHPTVVGLGDSFAGGLLPGLLKQNRGLS
ncbi:MAG: ADP-dependent glucokinase/phosphofructokinase [Oscillospiraceae bacterium]|nr:ADP-dependent glucokinase/phosphofructokinase [Oscillospiraceae bacterium]